MTSSASLETDVVVVGGGMAGFVSALRAVELDLRTVLLEKTTLDPSWSNARISGGAVHPCMISIKSPPEVIIEKLTRDTDGTASPELVRTFAEGALPALRWLQEEQVRFIKAGPYDFQNFVLAPPMPNRVGHEWKGRGPDVTLRRFKEKFVRLGGEYRNGHRVRELLVENRRVVGIVAETVQGEAVTVRAVAVILADGGFQANREMVNRYIGPNVFDRVLLRGTDSGTGDGIRMAQAVGAKLVGMGSFYGHCVSLDGLHDEDLGMFPMLDWLISGSMLVWKRSGRRFIDEGSGGVNIANFIARAEDPQDAVILFDEAIWEGPGTEMIIPPNPNLTLAGGTFYSGHTLDDLAARAGIDAEGLKETVEQYNRAIAADGQGSAVPRTGKPRPVVRPPFHAVPVVPGITFTSGGMLTNGNAEVLDEQEQPIPGLWAAGVTVGGLDGGPRCAYAGGLLQSVVFGKRAAESIRSQLARR